MRVITNDVLFEQVFLAKVPKKGDDLVKKQKYNDAGRAYDAEAPDGSDRKVYSTPLYLVHLDEDGDPFREERDTTIATLEPIDFKLGVVYELKGKAWVTHYQKADKTQAVSIIVEKVVPQRAGTTSASQEKPTS